MEVVEKEDAVASKSKVDAKLVKALETKFDKLTRKYDLELTNALTKFYLETFLPGIKWKGYECYAVSELHDEFKKTFKLKTNAKWNKEHIEATFHFVKIFEGTGSIEMAKTMKDLCNVFAKPMQAIQVDQQELKDLALELQAAENGISVEALIEASKQPQ